MCEAAINGDGFIGGPFETPRFILTFVCIGGKFLINLWDLFLKTHLKSQAPYVMNSQVFRASIFKFSM